MINEKDFIVMHALYKKAYSIRQIATLLKMDRKTVSKRLAQKDLVTIKRGSGPSKLDQYKEFLSKRIKDVDGAQNRGFTPRLCKPYRPQTKGKVERFNSYLKANFYRPLLGKLKDSGIEINVALMNSYINPWLSIANDRVHGTTKERPFARLPLEISKMLPCHQTSAISMKILGTTRSKVQAIPELLIEQHRVMLYE